MKNLIKLVGIIALVAVIGFSMIACNNGSTGGGGKTNTGGNNNTGNGDLFDKEPLRFITGWGADVQVIFKMGDLNSDEFSNLDQDFTLTIDGEQKEIVNTSMGHNRFYLGDSYHTTYTFGKTYKVKVVYTANPARKLYHTDHYTDFKQLVPSFSIERDLEYIDRDSLMSTRTITGHATVAANKIP